MPTDPTSACPPPVADAVKQILAALDIIAAMACDADRVGAVIAAKRDIGLIVSRAELVLRLINAAGRRVN